MLMLLVLVRLKGVFLLLLVAASLLPAWWINQWLQRQLQPRRSFGRFLLYLLACFALVFGYTFLITFAILKLFPPNR